MNILFLLLLFQSQYHIIEKLVKLIPCDHEVSLPVAEISPVI